jgi:primosomal protein N'
MPDPILITKITLPELIIEKRTIGNNRVLQLAQNKRTIDVKVYPYSNSRTCYKLTDILGRNIFLKLRGSRTPVENASYILKAKTISDVNALNSDTELKWEHHHRSSASKITSDIQASWSDMFSFVEENIDKGRPGLRQPQMGALHAIAAHWSVTKNAATIVMPTGTGKTEVMLSTLVSENCKKVVVIVPSTSLRDQIFDKFISLGFLSDIGVVPDTIIFPRVAYIKHGISRTA